MERLKIQKFSKLFFFIGVIFLYLEIMKFFDSIFIKSISFLGIITYIFVTLIYLFGLFRKNLEDDNLARLEILMEFLFGGLSILLFLYKNLFL